MLCQRTFAFNDALKWHVMLAHKHIQPKTANPTVHCGEAQSVCRRSKSTVSVLNTALRPKLKQKKVYKRYFV